MNKLIIRRQDRKKFNSGNYCDLEILYCLQEDYSFREFVSKSNYAMVWGRDFRTVDKILKKYNLEINREHPRQLGRLKITKKGEAMGDKNFIANYVLAVGD